MKQLKHCSIYANVATDCIIMNRTEWMKGICHIWSKDQHFSPSLPGNMYLKHGSKSDLRAEISESIVWYEALAPRPEVLRSFSDFYANDARWVFFLCKHKFSKIDLSHPLFFMRVQQRTKLVFRTSTFRMMAFSSTHSNFHLFFYSASDLIT